MDPDRWELYRLMLRSRLFEQAVQEFWELGLISGEMHLGTGEEAIVAGVVSQLQDGDAMALDHRGTAPMLIRGVEPAALLDEFLGRPTGICGGMGGHMHLYSRVPLAAASGIVGASGPTAVGFAMAAMRLRPGTLVVAFFGEGALNQGMLMESLNLASVWELPVLFVCKDNDWAISSGSASLTGGRPLDRAAGFGVPATRVDGTDVEAVWETAHTALEAIREGRGPRFLHARCVHLEGHFLDDPLLAIVRHPIRELSSDVPKLTRSFVGERGTPIADRVAGVGSIARALRDTHRDVSRFEANDPVRKAREVLATVDEDRLDRLDTTVEADVQAVVDRALEAV